MRKLVRLKSFFRIGRQNDDENDDKQQADESANDDKFKLSCRRKKKKDQSTKSTESKAKLNKTKTPPPPHPPKAVQPLQQSQKPQKLARQTPMQKQPMPLQSVKEKSTMTAPVVRKKSAKAASKEDTKNVNVRIKATPDATSSRYVNVLKSGGPKSVASCSYYQGSRPSSEGETTSSIRRFQQFSARAMRKVKTFVSRPVNEATVKKVAKRVEERRKIEPKPVHLTHGEDLFPKQQQKTVTPKKAAREKDVFLEKPTKSEAKKVVTAGSLPSGTVLVKNEDNSGKLFLGKSGESRPFWTVSRRPAAEDLEDSLTDDLQLNADVIFMMNGKVKLVPMPTIPVVLDPTNDVALMREKDKLFFNKDILYGNTVRTMINLSDQLSRKSPVRKKKPAGGQLRFATPDSYWAYQQGTWEGFEKKKFISKEE